MEKPKVVTISELVQRSTPHTAASDPGRQTSTPFRHPCDRSSRSSPVTASSSASHTVLTPLESPAILIGTLTLPELTLKCPNRTCLQFSDDSAAVCCDIICADLGIIGKRVNVHSWNFISFKHGGGGFLEIFKWEFVDATDELLRSSSLVNSFPLVLGSRIHELKDPKLSYRVHGILETVSPVSVVPISARGSEADISTKSRGFLVRIFSCKCKLCSSKVSVVDLVPSDCHSFTEPVFIYFCDFAWCWQPILVKSVGFIIACSGLRRKTVFIDKESELTFITTENTVLHLSGLLKKWMPIIRNMGTGNGECCSYMGTVSGMYLHGMVVELDKEVWLLLTDQLLSLPHSLRVGAIIMVRNVHIVNPKFSWRKMLILGTCFKSSITVQSFSPLESECLLVSQSDSLLEKFISSLAFSARFWTLLLVACFRKKLCGILSEKEILGSKHHAGLAQTYASSSLSSSAFRARHGVFRELYRHDSACCSNEPYHGSLKPAVPISLFIYQCESIWVRALSKCGNTESLANEVRVFPHSNRMIFQSDRVGVTLIGRLKVSYSGRLQLFDLTGTVDAIVPDLPGTWNHNSIVQVTDYTVVIEGIYNHAHHSGLLDAEPLSCRNIFHFLPSGRTSKVAIFVCFHLMGAKDRNYPFHPSFNSEEDNGELRNGTFHIIQVVHKFVPPQKFKGISKTSKSSSLFIEAILLPWDMFLGVGDGLVDSDSASIDQLNRTGRSNLSYSTKRHKINHSSSRSLSDCAADDNCNIDSEMSCFCLCREPCGKEGCISMSFPHEVSCLATIRDDKSYMKTTPDQLYCRKAVLKFDFGGKAKKKKILLEFNFVNYFKYQIGNYYIIKHDEAGPFCQTNKEPDHCDISSVKVIMTSRTFAWSISFSLDSSSPSNPFVSNDQPVFGNQTEVHQDRLINQARTHSDVCLHVPAQLFGFIESNFKELHMSFEKCCNFSSCVNNNMAALLACSPNLNLLHDGTLTSLGGDVTAVHSFDQGFDDASSHLMHFKFHGASRLCIHVSVTNHSVCIVGFLAKDLYPTGFGPGIRATFYRILELWDEKILLLTPTSYIVVNSLTPVNEVNTANCSSSCYASDTNCDDWRQSISPGLISDLIQQLDGNPKQFWCRVVAITFLVLEKLNIEFDKLESKLCSRPMIVHIPLAGFILDDGSASSCAWADGERAAKLLRLHEQCSDTALESTGCTFRWILSEGDASNTTMDHLLRILKIHGRITVRNFGSVVESSQDLTISVGSGKALAACDENLIKSVIFNSCSNTLWTVVAGMMDPNAESLLKKEQVMLTEASECSSRGRIWVREVGSVNQLLEARNLVAELTSG